MSTLLAAMVVIAYLPVVVADYGYLDDYLLLFDSLRDRTNLTLLDLSNGRPLAVPIHVGTFWLAGDIEGLRWLRLLTVLGIAAIAVGVMRQVEASGRGPLVAVGVGATVAAMPPMQVAAGWATCIITIPAVLLGLWAARLAERGRLAWAIVALTAASLLYQPGAMCFWVAVAIASTGPSAWPWTADRIRRHFVPFVAASMLALLGWTAAASIGRADGRSELSTNPLAEVSWFFGQVLPRAVAWEPARVHPMISAALLVALPVGLFLAEGRRVWALLALVPLSYAPSLVVADDWPTARSMTSLVPVLVVLYVRAAEGYAAALRLDRVKAAGPYVFVGVAGLLLVSAWWSVRVYISQPQVEELRLVETAVAELKPAQDVAVAASSYYNILAPGTSMDEFGNLSTRAPWVPVPIVRLIRHDQTGSWSGQVRLAYEPGPGVLDLDAGVTSRDRVLNPPAR
jgi:hypothetical protein